jgi:hypothetical protein
MNQAAGTVKLRSWKATNDTTYPLGAWHGLVAGNPPLDSVGEWRKLARLDKTEELPAGNIGARPIRHRGSKVLVGWKHKQRCCCRCRRARSAEGECERKKKMGRKSPKLAPDKRF